MTAPGPQPDPEVETEGSPWFQQLVRDGLVKGYTLEEWPEFDLFDSDEEADEFLEWLYRFRRTGIP